MLAWKGHTRGNDMTTPRRYRKKPVVIEAMQFTGDNFTAIIAFVNEKVETAENRGDTLTIHTLEGDMVASKGDYIIKGVQGEFYPCKPDIFEQTYEVADD